MNVTQDKLTLTNANTEYSYAIPPNCLEFTFRLRSGAYDLRYYFVTAAPSSKYFTLQGSASRTFKGRLQPQTIYFNCPDAAGEIVEIEYVTQA